MIGNVGVEIKTYIVNCTDVFDQDKLCVNVMLTLHKPVQQKEYHPKGIMWALYALENGRALTVIVYMLLAVDVQYLRPLSQIASMYRCVAQLLSMTNYVVAKKAQYISGQKGSLMTTTAHFATKKKRQVDR
ncbi:hypothetical protein RFI_25874 [Reticulomyxa filosa]|uniref:Uncharacterized protein n=1 Tax=Reticulomyxa filosa TaxID=46433 RepID=X6MDK6_RETFI|nr:hypothetical protein RFI_25874 [Reticulomyxa filosa]|eukprot:ETO11502.1 hypothetical protein RFI_25874 [Reticulomyxa filosa]